MKAKFLIQVTIGQLGLVGRGLFYVEVKMPKCMYCITGVPIEVPSFVIICTETRAKHFVAHTTPGSLIWMEVCEICQ